MANFLALRKTFEVSADDSPRMLVGRQNRNIPDDTHAVVTTMRKHYDISVDVTFDSNGGTACDGMTYVLGSTYKGLPVPTKSQHIFNGWTTATGQILSDSSLVELSNTTLIAQWEYVDIGDDCTEYIVSCNSSYKNTGIYAADRYSSTSAVYVDWGDGNVEKINDNISKLSHSYANAGIYTVKVSNNLASFAPSYDDSTWYNTTSQNRYTFKSMVKTGSNMPIASSATMPSYAFCYCQALSSIDWLSSCYPGLVSIPSGAFYYCQGIKSLSSLPSRIISLGGNAFNNCIGLTGIQDLRSTGLTSFYNSSVFRYCTNVTEWKLPSTLTGTYFGSYVFANNTKLSAIELPASLTAIASYCFQSDTQLKNISIPEKVQSIGNYAFDSCTSLSNVNIETTSLTAIDQYAFYNCNKLTGLDLPDTVKIIGNYAFYGCTSLNYAGRMANNLPYDAEIEYLESDGTQYINTEISVETEDTLTQDYIVTVPSAKSTRQLMGYSPQYSGYWGVTVDGYYELGGVGITNSILGEKDHIIFEREIIDNKQVHRLKCNSELLRTTTHDTIRETGQIQLFALQTGFICSLKMYMSSIVLNGVCVRNFIPVRVGNVGYMYDKVSGQLFGNSGTGSFILGPDVKTKELPSSLTSVGSYAYQGCYSLKTLDIPSSLTVLNDYAFAGCYNLSSIVDRRLTAQTTYANTFGSTASNNESNGYTGYATHGSNILCTYAAATGYDDGYWNDPLQNTTKCGFNTQYIDPENVHWCTIVFDAGSGSVSPSTKQVVYGKKIGELPEPTCPADKPYFGGWYTEADGAGTKYSADSTAPSQDSLTLYAFYSATKLQSYTVDISNEDWVLQDPNTNPDPSSYDGVYQSSRYWKNVPRGGCIVKMYIDVVGYTTFKVYIRSYGENNYSYAIALPPDVDPSTYSNAISQSYANTKSSATGGTAISNYTLVTYNLDGGEHRICIVYGHKDTIVRNDDRGYVLIPKDQ